MPPFETIKLDILRGMMSSGSGLIICLINGITCVAYNGLF